MRGYFITFEGIEGSGKSTVAARVAEALRKAGMKVLLTREPGGTAASERIREMVLDPKAGKISPKTELLLYLASRAQLVEEVIVPALAEGTAVICDRFMDASTAYQGWARGLGEELVEGLNRFAVGDSAPDLTFVLDLDVGEGFGRGPERRESSGQKAKDRLERESREFHEKVREGYLRIAERSGGRVVVIDARAPLENVVKDVLRNIADRLDVQIL